MQGEVLTSNAGDREVAVVLYNAGGGFSSSFKQPRWQQEAVRDYLSKGTSRTPIHIA